MSQEEQELQQPQEQTPEPPKPEDQPAQPAEAAAGSQQPAAVAAEAKGPEGREGDRPERPERPERGRDGPDSRRRPSFRRRKVCTFCVEGATHIDYKDPMKFRRFISDRARIEPRRKTGTCAKHQRWLSVALKRARHLALLPYTPDHIRLTGVFASRK